MSTAAKDLAEGRHLTWDEFLALPYETRNAALIDGRVIVNPPNAQHERIVRKLSLVLSLWTDEAPGRGEVSTQQPVKVNDHRGYQPDLMWFPEERCSTPDEPASFSGLPALVIEVLSPSTRSFDLVRKREDYERIGIDEVWFVDPGEPGVLVCNRADEASPFVTVELGVDDKLASRLLAGFELPVAELFLRRASSEG